MTALRLDNLVPAHDIDGRLDNLGRAFKGDKGEHADTVRWLIEVAVTARAALVAIQEVVEAAMNGEDECLDSDELVEIVGEGLAAPVETALGDTI